FCECQHDLWISVPSVANGDDGLDDAGFGPRVRREDVDQFVESGPVGDPGPGIETALLNEADDAREVVRQGVARTEERPLALVEHGMATPDLFRCYAIEHETAAVGR